MYKLHTFLKNEGLPDLTEYIGLVDYPFIDRTIRYFDPEDKFMCVYRTNLTGHLLMNGNINTV